MTPPYSAGGKTVIDSNLPREFAEVKYRCFIQVWFQFRFEGPDIHGSSSSRCFIAAQSIWASATKDGAAFSR
jgi:hypothetical protein